LRWRPSPRTSRAWTRPRWSRSLRLSCRAPRPAPACNGPPGHPALGLVPLLVVGTPARHHGLHCPHISSFGLAPRAGTCSNLRDLASYIKRASRRTAASKRAFGPGVQTRAHARRQVFLVTDKDATPGVFAALSVNLRKYKYVFADVHSSDAEAVARLGVKKVGARAPAR